MCATQHSQGPGLHSLQCFHKKEPNASDFYLFLKSPLTSWLTAVFERSYYLKTDVSVFFHQPLLTSILCAQSTVFKIRALLGIDLWISAKRNREIFLSTKTGMNSKHSVSALIKLCVFVYRENPGRIIMVVPPAPDDEISDFYPISYAFLYNSSSLKCACSI